MRAATIAAFALALIGREASGQLLKVSVRDTAGIAMQQVSLSLVDSTGRVIATTRTSDEGFAHLRRIEPGPYRVIARRFGFMPRYSEFVRVAHADTVAVRITLDRLGLVLEPSSVGRRDE